ncbi:lipopolysaccharide biosynthesis protein [Flagellimonas iocasae]|uniref:Lipopolysaccharide biosynthesis protein n=1 Tax=Flagellimonas iocasae TaxID=2055905 RepID=A0ABW4XXE0_9FLAO
MLKKINKRIFDASDGIGRDIFILSFGVILAQLIPFLLQPVLKRMFSPEEFGAYDVFLKTFSIIVAFSCFKYENAILLPKKDSDAKQLVYLCLFLALFVFLMSLIASIFVGFFVELPLSRTALIILPFSVLFYSVFNAFNMYLIRRKKFTLSSTNKISRRFFEGATQYVSGLAKYSNGLVFGDLLGNLAQAIYSFWKVKKISPIGLVSKTKIKDLATEYRELPIYTLAPNILNTFVLGSLTFLILIKFDIRQVGFIEFTQKILSIPSVFISLAVSQVVFQRISQMVIRGKKILSLLISLIVILSLMSIVFIVLIESFGEQIFELIGGKEWGTSGKYAKTLVYASSSMLIFSPLGKVLIALKKFKINSAWELGKFVAIAFLFFLNYKSIEQYILVYSILIVLFYLIYGGIIIYQAYKYQVENNNKTQ